jgi:hypothetical protein
MDDR